MARGSRPGERRGGRQKGTPNQRTTARKEIVERALAEGVSPLDVMLTTMRALWKQAVDANGDVVNIGKAMQANVVAKDAAPFLHPKLSSIEATGKDGESLNAGPAVIQIVGVASDATSEDRSSG
jgi:hypothetical protein